MSVDSQSVSAVGVGEAPFAIEERYAACATTVIEARPGWRTIDIAELWRYHELLYFLTWRDIKVRYKQTVLGALWAILQPVLTMVIFTVFFGSLGGMSTHVDNPYPVVVFAALLPWQFFATAVTQSGQSLIASSNLISKVYFPRLIVPFASVGGGLVDFAISFAVMFLLMLGYGAMPSASVLLLPPLIVVTIVTALGVGTLLSALAAAYRDFRYVIPFLVQIWMFASPVAYPLEVVPEKWRLLYALNPMAGIISGYRSALLNEPIQLGPILVSSFVAVGLFVAGTAYFRKVERRFADII
jgi:lipopolysaccharide transport system permease protein